MLEEGGELDYHTRVLPVCLALSACGLLVMLLAVRRLNLTNLLPIYNLPPHLPTFVPP